MKTIYFCIALIDQQKNTQKKNERTKKYSVEERKTFASSYLLVVVGILVYASANGNGKADRIINNENYRYCKY